jgi:hypothetical protein
LTLASLRSKDGVPGTGFSGPPHFDGKNYQMWQRQMVVFLRGKGQILLDVTVNTSYVVLINFLAPGSRDMFDADNKAVNYLYCSLCQSEFDRVPMEDLACRIWLEMKNAHAGNADVQARLYVTYRREYENFTHLPGEYRFLVPTVYSGCEQHEGQCQHSPVR